MIGLEEHNQRRFASEPDDVSLSKDGIFEVGLGKEA